MNGKLKDRSMVGCLLFWAIGEMIISGIAYGFSDWRAGMMYMIAIPYLIMSIPNFLLIKETPMFYL